MPSSSESRTEKATPKKREDERKKGNIFQSTDVVSSLTILTIFLSIKIAMPYIYRYYTNFLVRYFTYNKTVSSLNENFVLDIFKNSWFSILLISAPAMIASILVSVLVTGAQTRFKISYEKIKFKFSNISPLKGIARMFSIRSVVELLKSIIKTACIGYVIYLQIKRIYSKCIGMMYSDLMESVIMILNGIMDLVIQMSLVFIAIAVADYFYQWWEYERSIRMTKQELKEEYKQLEGNPEIKGKIRQVQRSVSRQRMMQKVPTADVVVRNPTHVAVALRYDLKKDNAPIVVAKGQDYMALKIVEIAESCSIPMKEDKPLARALYAAVEVGSEIPADFYQALAEVMAWVYRLKKERGQETH